MQIGTDLAALGAPRELVDVWTERITHLTDVQQRAIQSGLLGESNNLLIVAPTSSGKTLIGEIAATTAAFNERRPAIFIVPFRALADEHYQRFRKNYGHLLSVVISTSDWSEFDSDIRVGNFNLAVMTYEKLMGFLVHHPGLIEQCTTLVVDEVQLLSDESRGVNLELLLTRVMRAQRLPRIVALSASVDDVNHLHTWLEADLIQSTERPVPLTQVVCAPSGLAALVTEGGSIEYRQLTSAQADTDGLVAALVGQFARDSKQVIVFRSTVKNVTKSAANLCRIFPAQGIDHSLSSRLSELEESDNINLLRLSLTSGVAFHTADLTHPERRIAEDAFKAGHARVLVSTTTLAMGVNLPSDIVIVADSKRFAPGQGSWNRTNISVSEYRNSAGRAGRLGLRTAGTSILIAETDSEMAQLVHGYLLGRAEPIRSQIPSRPLTDLLFSIVAAEQASTVEEVTDFICATFAFMNYYEHRGGVDVVRQAVSAAIQACIDSGLVTQDNREIHPTELARTFAAASLSLASAVRLASIIEQVDRVPPTPVDLLFEVASCPESGDRPWLRRERGREVGPRPEQLPLDADYSPGSRLSQAMAPGYRSSDILRALVKTRCLLDWTAGADTRSISRRFTDMGAQSNRVRELGKNAAWLLETLAEGSRITAAPQAHIDEIRQLAQEARYGLPAKLGPLARLQVPGITRPVMMNLLESKPEFPWEDLEAILDADDAEVASLLSAAQLVRIRNTILDDATDSLKRKQAGHLARANQASLAQAIIDDLYTTSGGAFEQAVTDALNNAGITATRIYRQPSGEEDIQVPHPDGLVIVSVTASQRNGRSVKWNKAKEILGAGVGLNPISCVCIGRPGFDTLAERCAMDIGREDNGRPLLLIPLDVFAEAMVRIAEGTLESSRFHDTLARQRGLLTMAEL